MRTRSGVKVTVKLQWHYYVDITIDVPAAFQGSRTKGFCGVYNGNGADEHSPKTIFYEFIEHYR